ncbi:30S ribosomal protein S10 [Candidatus Nardonella dryophthoridicola]|uniref:30S ribosomal protein S10 n=1 Tax=Candidatus Nardonella dryophthoridicola TaxID=1971485 RepID=UPI001AD89072|nr:30S ribosomal protein S10 [Candidatus Nardonella dryophthoridicola]QTJ62846.1 30S ribosomal protein S10 [Candidatus Nardonella dryophthoridicola]
MYKKLNIIKIKVKSFDIKLINFVMKEIIKICEKSNATISGPIPLPNKRKKFIVLTSPHVNKDAREQFEFCIHNRLFYIKKYSNKLIDLLLRLNISSGIKIKIDII